MDEALQTRGGGVRNIDDVSISKGETNDVARELFDDLYGHEIPDHLRHYIDYDAFARDLRCGGEVYEFTFNGETYTCTSANS
jgi:hypothetical protein